MIWLTRTTDNSTNFAQSLEIRGIESGLYFYLSNNTMGTEFFWEKSLFLNTKGKLPMVI